MDYELVFTPLLRVVTNLLRPTIRPRAKKYDWALRTEIIFAFCGDIRNYFVSSQHET